MIGLLGGGITFLFLLGWFVLKRCSRSSPELIDILACGRNLDFHHFFAVLAFDFFGATKILRSTIVSFRTPSDVMEIAHCVHHEDIDIGWEEEHVLDETREHVPGFKVHEGADEVHSICGKKGDDNFLERFVFLEQAII